MRLILVRHGETEENVNGIIQGHLPGKLTKLGLEQAGKLRERLSYEKFDSIYTSDLDRARITAETIAEKHPKTPFVKSQLLRERNFFDMNGAVKATIDWDNLQDKSESLEEVMSRGKRMLDIAYDEYPDGEVLFVAHGAFIHVFICMITGTDLDDVWELEKQGNTAVNIIDIKEDKDHKVELLACTKHLL